MYNTLLNHPLLKEYWRTLAKEGFLIYDSTTQIFKTTDKGHRFLEVFSELGQRSREKKNKTKTKIAVAVA
jgi:predicted transcriptional regulator